MAQFRHEFDALKSYLGQEMTDTPNFLRLPHRPGDPWQVGRFLPTQVAWKQRMEVVAELPFGFANGELAKVLGALMQPVGNGRLVFIPGMMCGNRPILDVYVEAIRKHYEQPLGLDGTLWLIWGGDSALYGVNEQRVKQVRPWMQRVSAELAALQGVRLHLFAASMGTHIASQLVMGLPPSDAPRFESCTLAVADLPSDHFTHAAHRDAFAQQCGRTHILVYASDRVLHASRLLNTAPRMGTGVKGVELLPASFKVTDFGRMNDLSLSARIAGHSYFRDTPSACGRIGEFIAGNISQKASAEGGERASIWKP